MMRVLGARRFPSVMLVTLAACAGGGSDAAAPVAPPAAVTAVVVTPTEATIVVGGTTTVSAEPRSAAGSALAGRAISWSSSSAAVATVSASGVVTGVAAGTAQITATSEGRTGSATITVTQPVARVVLSADSVDVPLRTSITLTAQGRDAAGTAVGGRPVSWTSSAPSIASVSDGVVRMLLPGTVTITATIDGQSASARVRGSVARLDAIVDSVRLASGVPAMGGAIVARSGLIALGAGGTRRVNGSQSVTINDRWHIGSNTKAITGILAGLAVQAGVISWDRTLAEAFPDLTQMRDEYRPVTLRDLLTHTAGFVGTNAGLTASTDLRAARLQWTSTTVQTAPANARGIYRYSNNGYGTAGAMLERAWGGTYESLITDRLLVPLGITSGTAWGPTTTVGGTDQPVGHRRVSGQWVVCEACDNPPGLSSAGTMNATLGAWARIIQEVLRADAGESQVMTQTTARFLLSPLVPFGTNATYGIGWIVNGRAAGHDGSNTTNHSRASLFLDPGVAFLMTTNAGDLDGGLSGAALTALQQRLDRYWQTGR